MDKRVGTFRGSRTLATALAGIGLLAFASVQTGPVAAPQDQVRAARTTTTPLTTPFRVSSFNVLGAGHTSGSTTWASGETRMGWAVGLLRRTNTEVVGFQELQPPQFTRFKQLVGTTWDLYPGDQLSRAAMHNSIAWRTDNWQLVEARSIVIPYTLGARIRMPYVLLRNLDSGRLVYFANFHNASNPKGAPNQQVYRDRAAALQVALANRLITSGVPVVFTGDFNERANYFCKMTVGAPMRSASGGSVGSPCVPPQRMLVDWIFGSKDLTFSNYVENRGYWVRKTTDHAMVLTHVAMPADPLS